MKRFLIFVLVLLLALPVTGFCDQELTAEGLCYEEREQGIAVIGYMGTSSVVAIPSHINNRPVVEIAAGAFEACRFLTAIQIPGEVLTVGEGAFFGCESLEQVFYAYDLADWQLVAVGAENQPLLDAEFLWNYAPGLDHPLGSNHGPVLNEKEDTDTYSGNPHTQVLGTIIGGGIPQQAGNPWVTVGIVGAVLLVGGAGGYFVWKERKKKK